MSMRASLGKSETGPILRRQREAEETNHSRLIIKGAYIGDCVGIWKRNLPVHLLPRTLNVYIGALIGFSHVCLSDGFKNTLFSQNSVLEKDFAVGRRAERYNPRTVEGSSSLAFAWDQLPGHPQVMPSQWPLSTLIY